MLPSSSLLAFGLVGYGRRLYGYPTAPVVVRLILAPLAEVQFRRALQLSQGDVSVFVSSLISIILLTVAAIALILPAYLRWRGSGKALVQMAASED